MSNQSLNPEQVKKYLESLPESERAKFLLSNLNVDIQEVSKTNETPAHLDSKEKSAVTPKPAEVIAPQIKENPSSAENSIVAPQILEPDNHLSAEKMKRALEEGINDPQKLMESLINRGN